MVGGVDDDGIILEFLITEKIEQSSDVFVNGGDASEVVLEVFLVCCAGLLLLVHTRRIEFSGGVVVVLHLLE